MKILVFIIETITNINVNQFLQVSGCHGGFLPRNSNGLSARPLPNITEGKKKIFEGTGLSKSILAGMKISVLMATLNKEINKAYI